MTNTSGPAQPAATPSLPVHSTLWSAGRILLSALAAIVILSFAVPVLTGLVAAVIP